MNIALGTVILFIIVVPGIIMRRFYFTEEFSRKYIRNSIIDEMVFAIVPAFIIHFIAIVFIHQCTPYYIDFDTLAILLTNTGTTQDIIRCFRTIRDNITAITFYNVLLWNSAAFTGFLARIIVRKNKLDRKYQFLKYSNDWHYLLTGEFADFPKISGDSERIDLIYIDALVRADGKNVLYTGILVDYKLAAAGILDFLILKEAKRGYPSEKSPGVINSIAIPGDYFILLYNQVLNLNLTYYQLEEEIETVES